MRKCLAGTLLLMLMIGLQSSAQSVSSTAENVTVFKETNRFAGWPANNGIWSWGNELVVGFTLGYHDDDKDSSHPIKGPTTQRQARSLDGGETWNIEVPSFLDADGKEVETTVCPGGIDFTHPDFGFKFRTGSASFYYTLDRANTWIGPFAFPTFDRESVLARTDYTVNGKNDLTVFLTAPKEGTNEGQPFCARTQDGGKIWEVGYPHTVQRPDGKIVTVYYFHDTFSKERYIAATIWDPGTSESNH